GWRVRMTPIASIPPMTGIRMSIRTTSGASSPASSTAWAPFSASPTTSRSGSRFRDMRRPWRTTLWSSAITLRIPICPPPKDGPSVPRDAPCRRLPARVQRVLGRFRPGYRIDHDACVTMIRVYLVDDQPATRAVLRLRLELEADLVVVGESGNDHDTIT